MPREAQLRVLTCFCVNAERRAHRRMQSHRRPAAGAVTIALPVGSRCHRWPVAAGAPLAVLHA